MKIYEIVSAELKKYDWPKKYHLKDISDDIVSVLFPKCEVQFYENRFHAFECKFIERANQTVYGLGQVLESNNIQVRLTLGEWSMASPQEFIEEQISVIHKYLQNVCSGDFGWAEIVKEKRKNIGLIVKKIGFKDVDKSPIYQKMISGDPTWLDDLKR